MLITTKTLTKEIVMSHKHITMDCRNKIEVLFFFFYSARKISKILGFHHSTISREISRCEGVYESVSAQRHRDIKSNNKGRKSKLTEELKEHIISKLNSTWSPEQIVGRDLENIISFKTIYNWLYKGVLSIDLKVLRRKGKSRKPQEKRGRFNIGTSISKRPKVVKKRTEFGHWELDTVVSSRGKSKGCLATFAEMKTRTYIAIKMPDRSKESMYNAISRLTSSLPKKAFKSFTSDRGKEFACYKDIEGNLNIDFYFADAYSAWQRGTNENSNGLLREFYPKKTDLSLISDADLLATITTINSRPRKCLEFDTPFERFLYELESL